MFSLFFDFFLMNQSTILSANHQVDGSLAALSAATGHLQNQVPGHRKADFRNLFCCSFVLDSLAVHHDTLRYSGMYRLMLWRIERNRKLGPNDFWEISFLEHFGFVLKLPKSIINHPTINSASFYEHRMLCNDFWMLEKSSRQILISF